MLICPKCRSALDGFYPGTCRCGYTGPQVDSVFQFCDDPPISLEQEGRKYLGYEKVGANYDGPSIEPNAGDNDYGIFGPCSKELVNLLGLGCTVLDLGAGLGPAAISLAIAGANTIAADISQKMLSIAAQRAAEKRLQGQLIFARMNAYHLSISDNSVDAVVAVDVLHQLDNPEAAVKEILRVLKPAGVFAEYSSRGLPVEEEQREVNKKCTEALNDIENAYRDALTEFGYQGRPFTSWDKVGESIKAHFEEPELIETGSESVWTGRMAKGIHKLMTRASGSAQLIPDDIHNAAWEKANSYAVGKYGADYRNLPGYSKFSGVLKVYRVKPK